MKIEYLIVIDKGNRSCESEKDFIQLLTKNSEIKKNENKLEFENRLGEFVAIDFQIKTDETMDKKQRYFHLTLEIKEDAESQINDLVEIADKIKEVERYLKHNKFSIDTLREDVSLYYASQSYPLIHKIENLMRHLILKFMTIHLGRDWTKRQIPKEFKEKIDYKNEGDIKFFKKFNNNLREAQIIQKLLKRMESKNLRNEQFSRDLFYEWNFTDLSKYLFMLSRENDIENFHKFLSKYKPDEKIPVEELKNKYSLDSNWNRYFAERVACSGEELEKKWKKLSELRNKIAHNKLIRKDDFIEIKNFTAFIEPKLERAIQNFSKEKLTKQKLISLFISDSGEYPLHVASMEGNFEVVKFLVADGADINSKTSNDATPLSVACAHKQLTIVKFLIENGADINCQISFNNTPMHLASENNFLDILKYLIKNKAVVNVINLARFTPLHLACYEGHLEIVKELIKNKAEVDVSNIGGDTPLHSACYKGHLEIVKVLIENTADIDAIVIHDSVQDTMGYTPLHRATQRGHLEIVEYLIKKGANKNIADTNGKTALDYAIAEGHYKIRNFLRNAN